MNKQLAWHWVNKTLRDGSPIPRDGKWLEYKGIIRMCKSGLHASRTPWQALEYARGNTLCLVEVDGIVTEGADKLVCSRRKIIARMAAESLLRYFSRMQALSVVDKWDVPDVVLDWLMTGDKDLQSAAWLAAESASESASGSRLGSRLGSAESAARSAAWSAEWSACWPPTRCLSCRCGNYPARRERVRANGSRRASPRSGSCSRSSARARLTPSACTSPPLIGSPHRLRSRIQP